MLPAPLEMKFLTGQAGRLLTGSTLFASFAVKGLIDLFKVLVGDVSIDLSGGDIFMAEQFLNGPQISSA